MIELDGALGEGGGQVLRTALSLSLVTGAPFRVANVRANREKPGLRRQHLAALRAAAIGDAAIEGDHVGSGTVAFAPRALRPGDYTFDVGTAGSTTLVLQTVLPALLKADGPSMVVVAGGTHNPMAPPFEFLHRSFLPVLRGMGARVELQLERAGFAPRGGGRIRAVVEPAPLSPLRLEERGRIRRRVARAVVADLPASIAARELKVLKKRADFAAAEVEEWDGAGPGNVCWCAFEYEHVTALFAGFGRIGLSAERVAQGVWRQAKAYLAHGAPADAHLQDQLMVPLALAGGAYVAGPWTAHGRTNLEVVSRFVPLEAEEGDGSVRISRAPASGSRPRA